MPPKKVKDKVPSEKIYEFLTLEEMKANEQKFTSHINELRTCLNFIDDAISLVAQADEHQLIIEKWLNFVTCFPLPKPYKPADIRVYITKLKHFEKLNIKKTIDWTLSVDERSILSQSIFRKDLTRKMLKNTIKANFGPEYNENIDNCLKVLRLICYYLNNDIEVAKCSQNRLEDIKQLKSDIQEEINRYFDRYTYRILCSEDAYMESVDSVSSAYCFSTDNFRIHIWCLKNVPIRFALLEEPRFIANFHEIDVILHIPLSMLKQNLCIRAIHQNFDHITEYAKSFSHEISISAENVNAGIKNLPECLLNERLMQLNIQNRVRENMMQKRLEYEEKVRLYEEEAKRKSKKVEEGKRERTKLFKPANEPPMVTFDVYPDVWMDFLVEEQEQYEQFINAVYNPESMELDSDEINLKKFFILGGLYQLNYVRKPKHYDFDKFNMTWHQDDLKTLIIDNDICTPPSAQFAARRSTKVFKRLTLRYLSLKEGIEKESKDPECSWFVLTIKLPEYLCCWGEPIACHYETITKIVEDNIKEPPPVPESVKKKSNKTSVTIPTLETEIKKESTPAAEYYPLIEPQKGDSLSLVLKIKPLQGDFLKTSLASLQSGEACNFKEHLARDADGTLNIKDFVLTQLDKSQARHITRHLVPRIISSFKFPKEVREDKLQAKRNRPKIKGVGNLVRKQINVEDDHLEKTHNILTYNSDQNNPERMFSIYPREETIRIVRHIYNEDYEVTEPKSFLQLVEMIDNLKKCYTLRIRKTLDLQPFKSKIKFENKRAKERSKVKSTVSTFSLTTILSKSRSYMGYKPKSVFKSRDKITKDNKDSLKEPSVTNTTENSLKETSSEMQVFERKQKVEEEPKTCTYSHWTTRHILKSEYDKTKCTIVIQTDRLGYLGFAFKRYEHFPFKYWKLEPSETDPENEVIFTLETQYVRCVLYITGNGIHGHVTEPTKAFKRNPKMYLVIDKPMKDYTEFKKLFKAKYLNIFADHDASFYIENGYFCEKHLATEMHTYNCMALNCTQMKFSFSQWNRLSKRRDIILKFVQFKDIAENTVEVRITPEEAFFVDISELCSDDVDIIKLNYNLTWRNINNYSDLHHLINSMYPTASNFRCKNLKLISCLRNLLNEIRPLSFS